MASVDPAFYDSKAGPADQRLQKHIWERPGARTLLRWLTFWRVAIRTWTLPTPMIYVNLLAFMGIVPHTRWSLAGIILVQSMSIGHFPVFSQWTGWMTNEHWTPNKRPCDHGTKLFTCPYHFKRLRFYIGKRWQNMVCTLPSNASLQTHPG